MLALLALAPREIEVVLDAARLLHDLLTAQHQSVRIEQRTQVSFGEHTCRRRMARTFEAVQLECSQRVDRRELVGDQDRAAGPRHTRELGDEQLRALSVVQRAHAGGDVELERPERELLAVSDQGFDVRRRRCSSTLDGVRVAIDGHHLPHARRECKRECAGARTDVEGAFVAGHVEQPVEDRGKLGGPRGLQRRTALSLGHRRPFVHAPAMSRTCTRART